MVDTEIIIKIFGIIIIVYLISKIIKWFQTKPTRHISTHIKEAVLKRYFGMCAVCPETNLLEFHHRKEYSDGGDNSEQNIVPLCPKHHTMIIRLKNEEGLK